MLCSKCGNETFIDKVLTVGEVTTYFYVCMNPNCTEYRKSESLTGDPAEATIQPKEA